MDTIQYGGYSLYRLFYLSYPFPDQFLNPRFQTGAAPAIPYPKFKKMLFHCLMDLSGV
jgi:hypothetical protein